MAPPDSSPDAPSDDPVPPTVRRHAGLAALRQLRRMVDAEQAGRAADRRFVRRFLTGFLLVGLAVAVAWLWFRGAI